MGYTARYSRRPGGGYTAKYGKPPYRLEAVILRESDGKWSIRHGFGEERIADESKLRDLKAAWSKLAEEKYSADVAVVPDDADQIPLFRPSLPPTLPVARDIVNCEECNKPIYRWKQGSGTEMLDGCTCECVTSNGDSVNASPPPPIQLQRSGPPALPKARLLAPGACTICGHSPGNPNPCRCPDCGCIPF